MAYIVEQFILPLLQKSIGALAEKDILKVSPLVDQERLCEELRLVLYANHSTDEVMRKALEACEAEKKEQAQDREVYDEIRKRFDDLDTHTSKPTQKKS